MLGSRMLLRLSSVRAAMRYCCSSGQVLHPSCVVASLLYDLAVIVDFRHCITEAHWTSLYQRFADLDVSVLVNNVGINLTEHFNATPLSFLLDVIAVNCAPQALLSRLVVNAMLARSQRSAIISVSSVAGMRPLLYLAPYSATKAFNDFFSRSLALECSENIDVLSLRPGYVVSNMSKLTTKGGFVLDRYVRTANYLADICDAHYAN